MQDERNPAGGASKETHAEILWQCLDLQGNRTLRKEKMLGGLVKV